MECYKMFSSSLDSYFLEIWEPRLSLSDKWFPNFTPNSFLAVQTPKQGIPKLGVNFYIESALAVEVLIIFLLL